MTDKGNTLLLLLPDRASGRINSRKKVHINLFKPNRHGWSEVLTMAKMALQPACTWIITAQRAPVPEAETTHNKDCVTITFPTFTDNILDMARAVEESWTKYGSKQKQGSGLILAVNGHDPNISLQDLTNILNMARDRGSAASATLLKHTHPIHAWQYSWTVFSRLFIRQKHQAGAFSETGFVAPFDPQKRQLVTEQDKDLFLLLPQEEIGQKKMQGQITLAIAYQGQQKISFFSQDWNGETKIRLQAPELKDAEWFMLIVQSYLHHSGGQDTWQRISWPGIWQVDPRTQCPLDTQGRAITGRQQFPRLLQYNGALLAVRSQDVMGLKTRLEQGLVPAMIQGED